MSDGAQRPPEPPTCPRCKESSPDLIDVMLADWHFCNVCACPFRWPRPAEEFRGGAIIRAVPDRKG